MTTEITRHQEAFQGVRTSWFESGAGPALVLLHGGGGTGKAWTSQLRHFGERYRVIAPDLPGFGQSGRNSLVQRVDDLAPWLLAWLDALGVDRFLLAGNSMGGRVALSAAQSAPERTVALVLLSAVGVRLPKVPIQNPLAVSPARFIDHMVYDPQHFRRITPFRTLEDAKELAQGRMAYAAYQSSGIEVPANLMLSKISMPSLLIWGRHDTVIPLAYGEALVKALPDAELLVLERVAHLPHMEDPDAVNQAIDTFLKRRLIEPTPI